MKHRTAIDFRSLLERLTAEHATPLPKVSIYFSTPRSTDFAAIGKAKIKSVAQKISRRMSEQGLDSNTREGILRALNSLLLDETMWQHRAQGYVIFVSSTVLRYYALPIPVPDVFAVNDSFYLTPLTPLLSMPDHFYVIDVALGEARFVRVLPDLIVDLPLRGPEDLSSFRPGGEPVRNRSFHSLHADGDRSSGNGQGHGNMVPHGSGSDEKHDEIDHYLAQVARAVDRLLSEDQHALIVSGSPSVVGRFAHHLKHKSVVISPSRLDLTELHSVVDDTPTLWQRCEALTREIDHPTGSASVLAEYRQLDGTGRTEHDPLEIRRHACEGLVRTLLVREMISKTDEPTPELLAGNEALIETLQHGGHVVHVPAAHLPHAFAAILMPGIYPPFELAQQSETVLQASTI